MEALDNEQVASELGSVAGAVGDMTAAFVLLGGSGGALEETAQNIEKALGISMAFKGAIEGLSSGRKLFNNLLKQSNVLQNINNTATSIADGIYGQFSKSVDVTSKSFKTLRGAIIATGIGALVVAVGYLIANFDKLKTAINGVSAEQKKLTLQSKQNLELEQKKLDAISQQENILKLQGVSEREILKRKIAQIKAVIIAKEQIIENIQLEKDAQIEAEARNKRILAGMLTFIFAPVNLLLSTIDTITAQLKNIGMLEEATDLFTGFTEGTAKLLFDPEETKKNIDATIEETKTGLTALENELAGFQLSIREMDKTDEEAEDKKREADKERRAKMQQVKIKGNEEEKLKLVEQEKTFNQKMLELYGEDVLNYEGEQERKKQARLDFQNATFDLALSGINALMQINEAAAGQSEASQRKAFERNKKLQIAQALISGAQGIVNIWSSPSTIPQPYDAIYKGIQTAVLVALTATQISKIKKAKFSGGGGSTGGGVPNLNGAGGGSAPGLAPVSNTSTVVPQGDQQVFVTETDISATQNKVSVIEDQATIQ